MFVLQEMHKSEYFYTAQRDSTKLLLQTHGYDQSDSKGRKGKNMKLFYIVYVHNIFIQWSGFVAFALCYNMSRVRFAILPLSISKDCECKMRNE